ncbi:protein Hook homolog 3-like isoform X3 [Mytilus edulis]|uniref:protein Hook homolog 3-like isoform X3 n=1 Tax=Mytilus edulis TaxID=6550 RepID=UPI0039EF2FDC
MNREEVCDSLIIWMQTFEVEASCNSAGDLSDGVAMSQVLHQIAPHYFDESWLTKIKPDVSTNWRLKVSNLKKILKGILEFNVEILGIEIQDFQMPNVNDIGEHCNTSELSRLLQLILGCAVNCADKQEYIQRIMSMEVSVQQVVMNAIQELMMKEVSTNGDGDSEMADQLKKAVDDLNSALEDKEDLTQRCHELDVQVAGLLEEKQVLFSENERLQERVNQAENLDEPSLFPSTPAGKRYQQLLLQVEKLQEENFKIDAARDDYKIKLELMTKEFNDIKHKNTELTSIAEEARGLKDELDVLRHTSEQVTKYETMIESYKKKLDEMGDLRVQVKLLEEKNTKYMQEQLEMEEEMRKSGSMKQQFDMYKRQVHELQNKLYDETKRADKSDFEAKRAVDKMATLQREKERIATERDSLKEMNDEMKCTQLQTLDDNEPNDLTSTPRVEMLSLPPDIKEKILRLEHENKMLKLRSNSTDGGDNDQVLQSMLDDTNSRKNELETELRIANQKIMELESQVEDLQENQKTVSNEEIIVMKKKLNEQIQKTQEKDNQLTKIKTVQEEQESKLSANSDKIQELQDQLHKKEDEIKLMEAKYKKYLDKARCVLKSLDPKQNVDTGPEVQALRNQLSEKEKYIEHMEEENKKSRLIREEEEKYMVASWYNLGFQLHRQATEERLNNSTNGMSFLARQRQINSRRTQSIPNAHTNSSR